MFVLSQRSLEASLTGMEFNHNTHCGEVLFRSKKKMTNKITLRPIHLSSRISAIFCLLKERNSTIIPSKSFDAPNSRMRFHSRNVLKKNEFTVIFKKSLWGEGDGLIIQGRIPNPGL